jgi:hypothetical protein
MSTKRRKVACKVSVVRLCSTRRACCKQARYDTERTFVGRNDTCRVQCSSTGVID